MLPPWHSSSSRFAYRASVLGVDGVLRDVVDSDLDAFFEHQREPEANRMAAFPARDREAFDAHWRRLLADDSLTKKTIVYEGEVAGNIGCWEQEGRRLVGYWICLLYTSPSPRDISGSRMPSSA